MKNGFTLIELLIVISIIAILATIGMVAYNTFLKNARDTRRQTDLRLIQSALEKYHADKKYYPTSLNSLTAYLSVPPTDPSPGKTYYYKAFRSDRLTNCDNSSIVSQCTRYCLYALLETHIAQIAGICPGTSWFWVTSPD